MPSSLFGSPQPRTVQPRKSNGSFLRKIADFKRLLGSRNPQEIIENLRKSGRMTDQQFEELKEEAESILAILR